MPPHSTTHMSRYRDRLPQLDGALFLTDGGLETTLLFQEGVELPCFAAFPLLLEGRGSEILRRYFISYIDIARHERVGIVSKAPRGGRTATGARKSGSTRGRWKT